MPFLTDDELAELDEETQQEIRKIRDRKQERDEEGHRILREVVIGKGDSEDTEPRLGRRWRIFTDPSAVSELLEYGKKRHEEKRQRQLNDAGQSSGDGADSPGPDRPKVEHAVKQSLMGPQLDDFLRPDIEEHNTDNDPEESRGSWLRRSLSRRDFYDFLWRTRYRIRGPGSVLQIFDIVVECYMHDDIVGPYIEVYGTIATIDLVDNRLNYIFGKSREHPQEINATGGYLRLMNPARGIFALGCQVEIDIRIKTPMPEKEVRIYSHQDVTSFGRQDRTISSRYLNPTSEFETCRMRRIRNKNVAVTYQSSILREGVEATIELDFVQVPVGGFRVQMCGWTSYTKYFFSFINERRDCDGFIASQGKYKEKFVAAVSIQDKLVIDFMENGRKLVFAASEHGTVKEKEYRFQNEAEVRVSLRFTDIRCRSWNAHRDLHYLYGKSISARGPAAGWLATPEDQPRS